MKAAVVTRYGPPGVVVLREVATPEPGPGEVRIRVRATTVSAGDWRDPQRQLPRGFGLLRGVALGFGGPRRAVLGTEASGVVDAVGKGVTNWSIGDAVMAFPGSALGGHAEFLVMPATGRVTAKPANLTFDEAAALPFGGMTALDFLRRGAVRPGESVLINGASGGVGVAAVQLARHAGARVTAVCSARNAELVRGLGATDVVDYAVHDPFAGQDQYDVIVDTVGNAPYARVQGVLRPGGGLLAVLSDLPATLAAPFVGKAKSHRVVAGPASERPDDLAEVARLAAEGVLRPVIEGRFTLDRIADAHGVVETGRKRGAVVVSVDPRSGER